MDYAVTRDGGEARHDFCILTDSLLHAHHNRSVEVSTSWMEVIGRKHK
jgi:hypothetical protein